MYQLYLGNKNYSSWSLRGFLAMKLSGAPFAERPMSLLSAPESRSFSPTRRVPCLHDGSTVVWDSLSIAEYLAERHPDMWPSDPAARAWARSVAAEMHSGFSTLRNEMAMCIRERVDVRPWSAGLARDIARVTEIWNEGRSRFGRGGPYLCGTYSLADVFYAPVVFRFRTYGVAPEGAAGAYMQAALGHPFVREWETAALAETEIIEDDEPRVIYRDKIAAVQGGV
ncbi:MAG TPA: glutathione S-transferase family protein [Casimicrobiaceae bacterium]|nr:glutathione S-transferase family protein [Casimicrobiaceae bacterium]